LVRIFGPNGCLALAAAIITPPSDAVDRSHPNHIFIAAQKLLL
jgi:hypothetical protein